MNFIKEKKGFTLIEVIVTVAFIALVYTFVVQVFFGGYRNITIGDVHRMGVKLAENKLVKMRSKGHVLYNAFRDDGTQDELLNALKLHYQGKDEDEGAISPSKMVEEGKIILYTEENPYIKSVAVENKDGDTEGCKELKDASMIAEYLRTVKIAVEDINPPLVHIWVRVYWSDPRGELKSDSFELETLLSE